MYPGLPAVPTVTARYAVERLAGPPRGAVTNTAPTTPLALALARLPRTSSDRIWGALPVEEVEGHDVDPAYDVRPVEGLGRAPVRSERLASARIAGLGFDGDVGAPSGYNATWTPEDSSPGLFGISTPYLVLAGVAAVALGMVLKR